MPNYQNGMIYKLVNDENDNIYVGSTTQPLSKRFYDHQALYKYYLNHKKNFMTSFNIVKYPSCKIILIEKYPCNCKYELELRERHYIETLSCVNKVLPCLTNEDLKKNKVQYYKNNKECYLNRAKQYNIDNKEKRTEYLKQYYKNNKDEISEYKRKRNIYHKSWGGLLNIKMDLFL